jgi:hypothetical protein
VGYRVLVAAAVGAHFAFLAYAVLGGFLAWRWPRTIWLHLAGAGWLCLVVAVHLSCPLTWIEDRFRERAGIGPLPSGFISHYVEGVFFPTGRVVWAQTVVAIVVAVSWAGWLLRAARRRPRAGSRWRFRRPSPDRAAGR